MTVMRSEKIVVGEGTEYPLKGLLALPDRPDGKVPAVVLVHGSGASNMDEKIFKLTPFKDLAEGLAEHGIASIRYDKRTYVYGRKMSRLPVTVREETIEDALMAADLLKQDSRIDPDRVFIIGHSMGAMLAPRIDAEGGDFRGLILMAGSPFRLEEIVIRQLKQSGQSKGGVMKAVVSLEDRIFSKKFAGLYDLSDEEAKKICASYPDELKIIGAQCEPVPVKEEDDLMEKTKVELMEMLDEKGIEYKPIMNKAQLIALLKGE